MAGNTHRANCANAQNPGCTCSGCGGSLHGWDGWAKLAVERPAVRDERRSALKSDIGKDRTGALAFNAKNRQKSLDLARLDLANHLWSADPRPKGDAPLPRHFDVGDRAAVAFDNGRINILADSIMVDPWDEISEGIDDLVQNKQTAREVKKGLASHGWCRLLVALIQLIEHSRACMVCQSRKARLIRSFSWLSSRTVSLSMASSSATRAWNSRTSSGSTPRRHAANGQGNARCAARCRPTGHPHRSSEEQTRCSTRRRGLCRPSRGPGAGQGRRRSGCGGPARRHAA